MTSLWFASGESSLSVRRYTVDEAVSKPFEATIEAQSPREDVDLEGLLGDAAELLVVEPGPDGDTTRRLRGICVAATQTRVEPDGASSYAIVIAPRLWLLGQRENHRVFQHQAAPDIVAALLGEWGIEVRFDLDRNVYPPLEYRVQYGESDLAFAGRLLHEAGIAYVAPDPTGDDVERVILTDRLASAAPRRPALQYDDAPSDSLTRAHATRLEVGHALRPGRVVLRGVDLRRRADAPLQTEAVSRRGGTRAIEARLEASVHSAGAFVAERTAPVANRPLPSDDHGVARGDEKTGAAWAASRLAALREGSRVVRFESNVLDLVGSTIELSGHARAELSAGCKLLVVRAKLSGGPSVPVKAAALAVFADEPYRPPHAATKPVVHGVESAVVVGPATEEIHSDEFGRVRVQFAWDREGAYDDRSSCWVRVGQAWAGGGYGITALPRVGQEVIVGFFGGDPDQPVVVGRLHNAAAPPPNKLPEGRTKTTWRSASTPGGEGGNEITFDDARGAERLVVHAHRDLDRVVQQHESTRVGGERRVEVGGSDALAVADRQDVSIARGRSSSVGGDDTVLVAGRWAVDVAEGQTGVEVASRKITLSTGEARITLEGPDLTFAAAGRILLQAATDLTIEGKADIHLGAGANVRIKSQRGEILLQGGPEVRINPREAAADDVGVLPMDPPPDVDLDESVLDASDLSLYAESEPDWMDAQLAPGGAWDPARWGDEHEDFGHFHLGLVAAAAGLPVSIVARQLGKRASEDDEPDPSRGDPGDGVMGGAAPYGNDPEHYALMLRGAAYHRRAYLWSGSGE